MKTEIAKVAATATEADRTFVANLIAKATTSDYTPELIALSPAVCALLFLEHNPHNRDWKPLYTEQLARQIQKGLWRKNNASIGFYRNGALQDGQHRLAAMALSGATYETIVVYGIERDAIVTTDTTARRSAGDAGKLEGIDNAKRKQVIVKAAASYLVRAGHSDEKLDNETERLARIKRDDTVLDEAIRLGELSGENIVTPVLRQSQAETLAYLLLQAGGWQSVEVHKNLTLFRSGQSTDGEKTPFFVAAEWITEARQRREAARRLSSLKEIGVVVEALKLTASGVTAIRRTKLEAAIKQVFPDPKYPASDATETAAA